MAIGEYAQIERDRRRAWKLSRLYEERAANEKLYAELSVRSEQYLRDLLARLPFRWHVEHAYTPRETATYGGADHIVVDEPVVIGRMRREAGDTLSRARRRFWGLMPVEEGRLPSSLKDIEIAERIVAALPPKTSAQLDREIAEALKLPLR